MGDLREVFGYWEYEAKEERQKEREMDGERGREGREREKQHHGDLEQTTLV